MTTLNCDDAAAIFVRANESLPLKKLDDQALSKAIKHIAKSITVITGLKLQKDDAEGILKLMKRMLPAHYGKLTASEIAYAFELNSMAKLSRYTNADKTENGVIHHYQSFTLEYIGKVLAAYQKMRHDHAPVIQQTVESISRPMAQPILPPDPQQRSIDNQALIADAVEDFRRTGEIYLSDMTFKAMIDESVIDVFGCTCGHAFEYFRSAAIGKMIGERTVDIVSKSYKTTALKAQIDELKTNSNADGVDVMARKLCVIHHLKKMISTHNSPAK